MQTVVFEVDNIDDLVRLCSDTNMSKFTTEENNIIANMFKNTSSADPNFNLIIRLTKDLDLNYTDYWNKPEGSVFIALNRTNKIISKGGSDYNVNVNKCIDGGVYNDNDEVISKHSITNIYLRSGSIFIKKPFAEDSSSMASAMSQTQPFLKNIDIELVSNSGIIFFHCPDNYNTNSVKSRSNRIFSNVCFNVKAYNMVNPLFVMKRGYDYNETSNPPVSLIQFENCVFNIYIAVINDVDITKNCIFYILANSSTVQSINFYSCIFRIRNASNKTYALTYDARISGAVILTAKFDTCALFIQDIGNQKPTYQDFNRVILLKVNPLSLNNANNAFKFVNYYMAAFGDVSSNEKTQIILVEYGNGFAGLSTYAANCSSSFYDKDKVKVFYWTPSRSMEEVDTVWLKSLTTSECKNPLKLSEIGYIFCEET